MVAEQEQILVVEDDDDIALVMKARLASAGYDVHTESSGARALSYAAEHQPDLVVLDVRLPDLGGYEVCEELRKLYRRAEMPVVMFSVLEEYSDHARGLQSGADIYLPKSCPPMELLQTVEDLLQAV